VVADGRPVPEAAGERLEVVDSLTVAVNELHPTVGSSVSVAVNHGVEYGLSVYV